MEKVVLGIFSFFVLLGLPDMGAGQEMRKASQCFKSRGIPKVDFSCDPTHMVKIQKAYHGIALKDRRSLEANKDCTPSPGHKFTNCTFCDEDCVDDSMNLVYDWSTCMGNTSCTRTVMQSYMPSCPGRDKFSDYLQVEYQCIPRSDVIDICEGVQKWVSKGYLMSPNYPNHYPTNKECSCTLKTDSNSKILLSFYDLLLETKKGRCRADWLMLRQNGQKHRHCGAIMTGTKNITSTSNAISLQFHTDDHDNRTQSFQYFTRNLKGFWLYFTAVPESSIQINCRQLTHNDIEVKEIWTDDSDYDEIVNTRDNKVKSTTTYGGSLHGKGEGKKGVTQLPGRGQGGDKKKNKGKDGGIGKENETGSQAGKGGAPSLSQCSLLAAFMIVLLSALTEKH